MEKWVGFTLLAFVVVFSLLPYSSSYSHTYMVINFNTQVDPGAVSFFQRSFSYAESQGISIVIINMNTPGGLLDSMLSMVNITLEAESMGIKVITYVPPGGMAASAGSYIAMASDMIYMANGTFIGPSTPIVEGIGVNSTYQMHIQNAMLALMESQAEKHGRNVTAAALMVTNNIAYPAEKAYSIGLIDGIVNSFSELISILNLQNYQQIQSNPSAYDQFISFISNPTVDGLLMTIGLLAILLDLYHATVITTIVGIILIALGLWGAEIIGGNIVGLLFIVIGGALIIAEIKVGHGFLMITGIFLAIFGTWLLASGIPYSPSPFGFLSYVAFGVMGGLGFIAAYYLNWVRRTLKKTPVTGPEAIIGKRGKAITDIDGEGEVRVEGIIWHARSNQKIERGKEVVVKGIDGLVLLVEEVK
ncbi:MAG: NfeD family protein [Thermoplasmata archaeon]|jgi:membrane-bound serine protease (ClpP class)|nr:nodulation protein NfeD [Thermoplasmatales archaeon]PMP73192.1 MAG: serine protease [Aciduliprofundum sp.]HEU12971.1 nodulation protein NfeD [Euryarchaeota archaeon]